MHGKPARVWLRSAAHNPNWRASHAVGCLIVLADTSIWIDHFRLGEPELAALLSDGLVLMHPFVSSELPCGNLKHRPQILWSLHALPAAELSSHQEALEYVHLLASALLSRSRFWTRDKRLAQAAAELGL